MSPSNVAPVQELLRPEFSHWVNCWIIVELDAPSQQILRQRVWKHTRQLIRWPRPGSRKTFNLAACSVHNSSSTVVLPRCSIPALRLLPLQPEHGAVCVGPCWGLLASFLLSSSRCALNFFLNTFSLTCSSIDRFDIAARYISVFIPSCLDLVVRLSLSYRHRHSRHSLRDTAKTKSTHHFLLPLSDRGLHIHNIPRDVDDLYSTYIFTSISPGAKLRAVNHTAATLTLPPPSLLAQTNTRDATLVN